MFFLRLITGYRCSKVDSSRTEGVTLSVLRTSKSKLVCLRAEVSRVSIDHNQYVD